MGTKNTFNPQCITYSQMELIFNSRIYFRRLTAWTRIYMISRYLGIGSQEEAFEAFYNESLYFGNLLKLFFGDESANLYSQYISKYVIDFRDLLSAQISGDLGAINKHVNDLYEGIDERAAFLASLIPNLDETTWRNFFHTYLQYTIEEANSFASKNYSKDIAIFDSIISLSNQIGDFYAQSLYNYVTNNNQNVNTPAAGNTQCLTEEQVNEIYNIRMLWFELATWLRAFMLSRYFGIGDVNEVYNRLQQVPDNFINTMKRFFGDNPRIDDYHVLLDAYIDLFDSLITAIKNGKTEEANLIIEKLHQNVDDRAETITALNPSYWNVDEWKKRLNRNLDTMLQELNTFATNNFTANFSIIGDLLDQAASTSGYFAKGLVQYINSHQVKGYFSFSSNPFISIIQ